MTQQATGMFEVQMTPQELSAAETAAGLGRLALNKRFYGDLEGTGAGTMLTLLTPVESSAGYVAIERVEGMLNGRRGSFALQHNGTMTRGAQRLTIDIVPDSGTGELAGIAGTMTIAIDDGEHRYELQYVLA